MADLKQYTPGLSQGVTIDSGDMNPAYGQRIVVSGITAAQIAAMQQTPVQVIAAPGAGLAIVPTDATIELSSGTAYTAGGAVGLSYGGTATYIVGTVSTSIFYNSGGTTVYMGAVNGVSIPSNTALYLANGTANFATGTSTATLNIWYAVISV